MYASMGDWFVLFDKESDLVGEWKNVPQLAYKHFLPYYSYYLIS